MKISDEKIKYLAEIAMIEMDAAEREAQRKDLEKISSYTKKLDELDTKGSYCQSHPDFASIPVNRFRSDEVTNEDRKEEWIKAAPDNKGSYIRVPRTIEE
jgi:aspartyl/glutamyl-tRNA(Asn/Gln) amidotransferase C subunit